MKNSLVYIVMTSGVLLNGCGVLSGIKSNDSNYVTSIYPIETDLGIKHNVTVKFESPQAQANMQTGLLWMSKYNKESEIIDINSPKFFPDYLAIANQGEGADSNRPFYISDRTAEEFSSLAFRLYQREITPSEFNALRQRGMNLGEAKR